jgi:lysozyme
MKISQKGLDLITKYEGWSEKPYLCPAGKMTIGFGHLIKPNEQFTSITQEQGLEILKQDVEVAEIAVSTYVKAEINQNIFDSLVSFTFNLGTMNLRTSTLLKLLNKGDYHLAGLEFCKWNKAGGKILQGLISRRVEETVLFIIGAVKLGKM